jgi:WhiB family redox-sensing transcriptional regulator
MCVTALKYLGWFDNAACKGMDGSIFFPDTPTGISTKGIFVDAQAVCKGCAVKKQCLAFAMEAEEFEQRRYGVWGGKTPAERSALRWGN